MMDRPCILYMWIMLFMISIVHAADHEIEVNYDVGDYKFLKVNQTLELICKNKLNRDPPSWRYPSRLYNDPRMKLSQYVGESRLVISNAQAGDAGQYGCSIDHEYNDITFHFNKTIEVIVNEILDVRVEEKTDSIQLSCCVEAYPSPIVIWKIDYDKEEMKPQEDEPDEDYWIPPGDEDKVVIDKSEGRWTLRPYKGVNNAELIIANATENDNGKYSCLTRNVAGEVSKKCTVIRSKRGVAVEGKSTTATLDNSNVAETETDNSQEVEGLDGVTIALIVLALIVLPGCVLGAVIAFRKKKLKEKRNKKEKKFKTAMVV